MYECRECEQKFFTPEEFYDKATGTYERCCPYCGSESFGVSIEKVPAAQRQEGTKQNPVTK